MAKSSKRKFTFFSQSNGEIIKALPAEELKKETVSDNYRSIAFNKDGSLLVTSGENKAICVWNTSDWSLNVSR